MVFIDDQVGLAIFIKRQSKMGLRLLTLAFILYSCLSFNSLEAQVQMKLSIGASAGGSGVVGIPLQLKFSKSVALDLGVYLRAVHVDEYEDQWFVGPSADLGINVFVHQSEKPEKYRTVDHGFYIKGAYGLHIKDDLGFYRIQERMASLGWVYEMSKSNNAGRFFQIQIGPSIIERGEGFLNTRYPPDNQYVFSERYIPMIYGRFSWFFTLDKTKKT